MTARSFDPDRERRPRSGDTRRVLHAVWVGVTVLTPILIASLAFLADRGWWPFDDYVRAEPVRIDLASSVFDAPGYDDPGSEYVCLVNTSGDAVDLTGWVLRDARQEINVIPRFTLQPGASVRVHSGMGTDTETDLFGTRGSPAWTNEGDAVTLLDADGEQVDSRFYGPQQEGRAAGDCR